jgi:hypothetical protein
MTTIVVSSGHTSTGLTLGFGTTMSVLQGGSAVSTTVNNGGLITDFGTTSNSIVNSGGSE